MRTRPTTASTPMLARAEGAQRTGVGKPELHFTTRLHLLALLFALQLVCVASPAAYANVASAESTPRRLPHVVIVLVDDMGYGDPKCFNPDSKISTPNIDGLASRGMKFTDAHAPGPLCHLSRYGLITGRYPFRTDITRWRTEPLVSDGQETIATVAKQAGYRTAMVGKWHLGFDEQGYDQPLHGGPVDCGFDSFFGMRASTDIPPYFYIRDRNAVELPSSTIEPSHSEGYSPVQGAFWRGGGIAPGLKLQDVLPKFTEEAIGVIEGHSSSADGDSPLLLYLAYPSPHTPWLPSEQFAGKSDAGLYGDFVMMVDHEIGRVLQSLQDAGMSRDTLVVFSSDNGPVWLEDDRERFGHDSAGGLRGMKGDAWEAGHRMPFIVSWPGVVPPSSTSKQTICFTDLLATLADIFEQPLAAAAELDSYSFLPELLGLQSPDEPVRPPVVTQAGSAPEMFAIRGKQWKYISALGSGGFSKPKRIQPSEGQPTAQLYDLEADPGETNNLFDAHPEVVAKASSALDRTREAPAPQGSVRSNAVDFSTLHGKVMCGYQGWFNVPDDGMELGWKHWARNSREPLGPGNITIDLWPDLSELDEDERYPTEFRLSNGDTAEVYSSTNKKTIHRHFDWMREHGIDGVFLQRFANGITKGRLRDNKDKVLAGVRSAAQATGRAYVVMYDLSGLKSGQTARVFEDWKRLRNQMRVTSDRSYLSHNGKPLVAVWGVGFDDGAKPREYSLDECRVLVQRLKDDGCSVMLGVPTGWLSLTRDAMKDERLHEVIQMADVVSPWTPGRYRDRKEVKRHAEKFWGPDTEWCESHSVDYFPVVFPGFSWHNLTGSKLDAIPREGGRFLWSQFVAAKRAGAKMAYVAMFDEVDEGTAIFKCTNEPPVGEGVNFLTYEGLPSDHYLWLTGEAARMFRGERPATPVLPRRE